MAQVPVEQRLAFGQRRQMVGFDEATHRVTVAVEAHEDQVTAWVRSLERVAPAIDDIALRPPTLNEVFLALTGQQLEEQPAPKRRGRRGKKEVE